MPVAAVTSGGSDRVSSGSTTASRGSMSGLRRLALTPCSGERSTALRVASAPAPAVVGTATIGSGRSTRGRPWPITSR